MRVSIFNETKNKQILDSVVYATSFFDRLKGLIPYDGLLKNEGMFLFNCTSIHTFFMSFAIDCYFLDKENRVLKIANNLKPYRFFIGPFLDVKHVLEVASLSEHSLDIDKGDILRVD